MSEPTQVEIAGIPLRCRHCSGTAFNEVSATLDRIALGGLLHLEGSWGHQVNVYACDRCGLAHVFFPAGDHEKKEAGEKFECLACGQPMEEWAKTCPACNWTWGEEAAEPLPE